MKSCLICGKEMESYKIKGLVKCYNCGFVSADLKLSNEEIEDLYREDYYKGRAYTDYLADEVMNKHNFRRRLSRIEKIIGSKVKGNVLEIGCAYGMFLDVINSDKVFLRGIDISSDAVSYAKKKLGKKAEIIQGDYIGFPIEDKKYDLICMWDTIEHLSRPDEYITKASRETKKGGFICITTGDINSLNARIRGRKWRLIHPPEHLHYFSKQTLKALLEKNGFKVVDVTYPGERLSLRHTVYSVLCLILGKRDFYEMICNSRIMDKSIYINLHDYMFVIAQKE